jgi:DNA-binding PadR family transcriptional regulator
VNTRLLCLGILSSGDATGYEIRKKTVDGWLGFIAGASFGSIYPALSDLTSEGLATCKTDRQPGKPSRKIYSITDQGRSALTEMLGENPKPDRYESEFLFAMSYAALLPEGRALEFLDDRIAHHKAQISHLESEMKASGSKSSRFAIGYVLAAYKAALQFLIDQRIACG